MHFNRPGRLPPTTQAIPSTLDWDLWKGPTDGSVGYNETYPPKTWRGYYRYGKYGYGKYGTYSGYGTYGAVYGEEDDED